MENPNENEFNNSNYRTNQIQSTYSIINKVLTPVPIETLTHHAHQVYLVFKDHPRTQVF